VSGVTVPPARQCTLPDCEREAVNPSNPGALCDSHLDDLEDSDSVSEPETSGSTEQCQDIDIDGWSDVGFADPEPGRWPSERLKREQWMGHVDKKPFSPWADRDHPDADPDEDARWKWGLDDNHVDGESARIGAIDPRVDGLAFIQTPEDPFAYVDGDAVRDPETGDVHPAFIDVLEHLGLTYADVSQSDAGVHAPYRGELPDGVTQAAWELADEPWGANEAPPSVEIYAGKRVCVDTGAHVPGTPTEIREWSDDGLETLLEANDQLPDRRPAVEPAREKFDLESYEPSATSSSETTDDIRDLFAAIDRLDARDIAARTIVQDWNDDASTSGEHRAFWPTWGAKNDNGTANVVNRDRWMDTGAQGGYGGPVSMAAIDANACREADPPVAGETWWRGVEHLRSLGYEIPEFEPDDGDCEHVVVLPQSPVARADRQVWDWRAAPTNDEHTDPLTEARDRTQRVLEQSLERYEARVLVEALPTLRKSSGVIRDAATTGEPITVHTGRGRNEQYDQFQAWTDDHGLSSAVLPSFTHECPTARGDHGDDWQERVMDWYRRGATGEDIHKYAEQELGRPLPCQLSESGDPVDCKLAIAWNAIDFDDTDVLIGHYTHAHKPKVVEGRTVVFDEFPGNAYETTLDDRLPGAVTQFCQRHDALPFDDYTDLTEHRDEEDRRAKALAWFLHNAQDALRRDPAEVFAGHAGHAAAPLATFTLLAGDDLGNGWEHADLEAAGSDNLDATRGLYNREQATVTLLDPPSLERIRGIVGLDGTPTPRMWQLALGSDLYHRQVLSDDERREYIQDGLGLQLIRTTDAVKPYNNPDYVATHQDAALLEAIRDEHDTTPGVITSSTALKEYETSDDIHLDALAGNTAYYGNVLGSNEFSDTRVGAVIGSMHYGDNFIKKWAAYDGAAAERNDEKGIALGYGDVGDEILTHMRDHQTLQTAMRFGRDGNGAVVYIHTNTLPEWVPIAGDGRVLTTWSDGRRQVIDALADLEAPTTAEIADHPDVEIGLRGVFDHLETLADRGVLDRRQDDRDGRRLVWRDNGIDRLGDHGDVEVEPVDVADLDDDEVQELARSTLYTWEFMNLAGESDADAGDPVGEGVATDGGVSIGGDPPPGDAV
jgi:hypothetical protein